MSYGNKPKKKHVENRLKKIFRVDRFDKRQFSIVTNRGEPYGFLNVVHEETGEIITKIDVLSSQYGMYTKKPGQTMRQIKGKFSANLDDFEDELREVRDEWREEING